ncbi:Gamma-glutamyl cyclotransferase, AIG2-like [Duganella sp. CF458]|uniref:gamma-glutamylcyclotransferase family protein n=1 Tax=Duganella sp. CF458 TaxID=1884368 RepID=UPI0008EDDE26|nr:gamma-glutamylcyclotransferase family protein [Duganella sp. CF458]SFG53784.1 Gamma-glutamyl cyclotransferase, AIG2-like [Duganella sp. CF458]
MEKFEKLFSYGTLQQDGVQLATFGRKLESTADELNGYKLGLLEIDDPAVVATSGKTHHPIISRSGSDADTVSGSVLLVTPEELQQADQYEVAAYRRHSITLASGTVAWAYVDARDIQRDVD